ncbi:BCAM0308 family protein [Aliifodinibius sp. S!AR15-10]|uniref:BCAM0308 family protein n=1 Tax=Aliifodinibius sp. S!AR15-10 TaxID=2950437 RepID=UPI0028580C5E|nr:BCAM0308 family protein [Aliifodinibius sp. S!AR15-10]MDR8393245.1 BCAM0308 family protein [Aliifodinibius sp. S!AR15-10]
MKKSRVFKQERHQIFKEKPKDPYRSNQKLQEPTVCSECGALFANGRWCWQRVPDNNVNQTLCPACQRITDNYPAGFIELGGDFFREHYDEIINLVKNTGEQEENQHPLERIIKITKRDGKTLITTTGLHIARRIGDAIFNSYQGSLEYNYAAKHLIRVNWQR